MHALKSIVSAIIAGGWVSVIVLICIIGAVAGSVYGIFYSAEDNGTGMTVRSVVQEINTDFDNQINTIKTSGTYDSVEINGATVYGYALNPYGHVGIYIGNGQVIHNLSGTVKVQTLESWVKGFNGFAWGFENGIKLCE